MYDFFIKNIRIAPFFQKNFLLFVSSCILAFFIIINTAAGGDSISRKSGLPIPRFVSIKAAKAHARVGPGLRYPIIWLYQRPNLPVEIVQEYDSWRKVRDSRGQGGWIYRTLLSNKRTVLVAPWIKDKRNMIVLRRAPHKTSPFVSLIEAGSVAFLRSCDGKWCEVDFSPGDGFIEQRQLWGIYSNEIIK